jgi:hypothetical protein
MSVFNSPVTLLPKPEDLKERLFPASFAVSSDDREVRMVSRFSFPNVPSPETVSFFAAARAAAASKARAEAEAAAAAHAPPAATKGATKGATKPGAPAGGSRVVPKD